MYAVAMDSDYVSVREGGATSRESVLDQEENVREEFTRAYAGERGASPFVVT